MGEKNYQVLRFSANAFKHCIRNYYYETYRLLVNPIMKLNHEKFTIDLDVFVRGNDNNSCLHLCKTLTLEEVEMILEYTYAERDIQIVGIVCNKNEDVSLELEEFNGSLEIHYLNELELNLQQQRN